MSCSFRVSLKSDSIGPPVLLFLRIDLASLGPLLIHINFRINLLVSTRKACWSFDYNCNGSTDQMEENRHDFIREHGTCLRLLDFLYFLLVILCSFSV